MKRYSRSACIERFSVILFMMSFAGLSHAADDTPPGKVYVYKQSGAESQKMEIYFPPDHDPAGDKVPGILLFHGGGWGGGDLIQFRTACQYFASRGLVAATANYQLAAKAKDNKLPESESRKRVCITDAKSAIRWMKQHAGELGVDPNRIITGGGSAGGHVSTLSTLNPGLNDPADSTEFDTSVVAYLLFNPAFSRGDVKDTEIDVLRHIGGGLAPAIAFFGTEDNWKKGWDVALQQLRMSGNETTEVWIAEGQGHGFFNREPWKNVTIIAADRFLTRQGLLEGEPTLASPLSGETLTRED